MLGEIYLHEPNTQACEAFAEDRDWAGSPFWMLNLLKYAPDGGNAKHGAYVRGGGEGFPGGSLQKQFGVRVQYASTRAFRTLIGGTDWDAVGIAEYPSRDHFLSMGACPAYRELHGGREGG